MGQLAVSVAGAVVGGVIGSFFDETAEGAELGFMIGGAAGAMLFHQNGPSPSDLRIQDSAYGKPIPRVYGLFRVAGNVIWAGQPYVSSGGKGAAPSQASVSMSFAVGICEGPIVGIQRIWANGKLIYDVSNPSNFQALSGSNQMVTNFVTYLGDENQMPDPTIQADKGIANTPPFRGLAYVVFNELDLSTWGNYLPALAFEVMQGSTVSYTTTGLQTVRQPPLLNDPTPTYWGPSITQIDAAGNCYGAYPIIFGAFAHFNYIAFEMTAYGTTYNEGPLGFDAGELAYAIPAFTSYDEPGILCITGWWYALNQQYPAPASFNTGFTGFSYSAGTFATGIKRNGIIAVSEFTGNAKNALWVWNPANQSVDFPGFNNTRGDTAAAWYVLAITTNCIYAWGMDPSDATFGKWIVQFDLYGNFQSKIVQVSGLMPYAWIESDNEIYLANGTEILMFNGSTVVDTGIAASAPFTATTMRVQNGNVYFGGSSLSGPNFAASVPSYSPTACEVSTIVSDICTRAGLSPSQFDTSQLTDVVTGYAVTNHSSPRANINPLMATYFFDASDAENVLRFVRRGGGPVGSFAYGDLGSSSELGDNTNTVPYTEVIAQEVELPRSLTFSYNARNADYQTNTQRAFKARTNSNQDVAMQAPIVLADDEALMRTQSMLWAAWVGRRTFQFSSSLAYIAYEPGDVMTLNGADGRTYTISLTRCIYDGQGNLQWEARLEQPDIYPNSSYTAQGGSPQGFTPQQIEYSGPTVLQVLDIPPLRDSDTTQGLYLAACGMASNWPGAAVDISRDNISYSSIVQVTNGAAIGYTTTALGDFASGNIPDELNTVNVTLYSGSLSSCSYASFIAGVNAAYIGGEIVFFRNATQTGALTYTLSGFVRARVGTENYRSTHVAGDTFVLLNASALAVVPLNLTDIGATLSFETFLLNLYGKTPSPPITAVPSNARVKPLAPHLLRANHGSSSSINDISLSWFRRARVNFQWLSGTDVPLDESSESYQLQISKRSGVVVRTVTVTASGVNAYTYTAANISADGFSTGNTINFSVAQNSDQGVLGFASTTTIIR